MALPRLAVLSVLSAASSPCPDLNLIHYISIGIRITSHMNMYKNTRLIPHHRQAIWPAYTRSSDLSAWQGEATPYWFKVNPLYCKQRY